MRPTLEPGITGAIVFTAVGVLTHDLALALACLALNCAAWALFFVSQAREKGGEEK